MNTNCQSCGWIGDVESLKVREEADHEVWKVYSCPKCGEKIGRDQKHTIHTRAEQQNTMTNRHRAK